MRDYTGYFIAMIYFYVLIQMSSVAVLSKEELNPVSVTQERDAVV